MACGGNGSSEPGGMPSPAPGTQLTEAPLSFARIDTFELKSDARFDPQGDPKGGGAYITKQDITLRAHVSNIVRLDAVASQCGSCGAVQASVTPEEDGNAEVTLHLPATGIVYVVTAYGVLGVDYPLPTGGLVNSCGEPLISGGSIRVKAIP